MISSYAVTSEVIVEPTLIKLLDSLETGVTITLEK